MTMHNWLSTYLAPGEPAYVYLGEGIEVTEIFHPEIPPPVWDERKIDADKAMAAVRSMCGG